MALVRFIAAVLSRLRNFSYRSKNSGENQAQKLGKRGERIAARYLRQNGYRILYRNFRAKRGGEVDLVCRDKREAMLVFVEVKTRSDVEFGEPSLAVTREKQLLIERGAYAWLRMLDNPDIFFRFDVVEIVMRNEIPEVNLIKNAFDIPDSFRF